MNATLAGAVGPLTWRYSSTVTPAVVVIFIARTVPVPVFLLVSANTFVAQAASTYSELAAPRLPRFNHAWVAPAPMNNTRFVSSHWNALLPIGAVVVPELTR